MPLTSKLIVAASALLVATQDLGDARTAKLAQLVVDLADGTAAGQANRLFADTRTIAPSGTDDLDLAGVLTDPLGTALTFVKVKAIIVKAADANTNNVVVGGALTTPFVGPFGAATHTAHARPGGILAFVCGAADANGWSVGAGASDLLRVANSGAGTPVTYDIVVIGTSV